MKMHEAQPSAISRHRYNEWNLSQNLLSQINTITSFVKIKISDFQNRFHNE